MNPVWLFRSILPACLATGMAASSQTNNAPLLQRPWFEAQTAHFDIYSCGKPSDVLWLSARLEQFREAFRLLAGSNAVASPPIVVLAFPDHESMLPYLPQYHGKPDNLAAFFQRGGEENLIVLSLPEMRSNRPDLQVVFHEYTHFLFRRNDAVWPMWLKEGMAEVYSTFQTDGRNAWIGHPMDDHLALLAGEPWMPLTTLFAVTHDSPQYNERDRQGIFYAESWLLTQFLVAGDVPAYRSQFGKFTGYLLEGQPFVQAFTNALQSSLSSVEVQLHRYFAERRFAPVGLRLPADISSPVPMTSRFLAPVDVYFRLGDELLLIDQSDLAESYFQSAQRLMPESPLPCEGLGLLAALHDRHDETLREMDEALRRGSTSYRVLFFHAREKYRLTADPGDRYKRIGGNTATQIHDQLAQSMALMPDFAPADELMGFFEMVQGRSPDSAEQHLRRAIELEPENPAYRFSLAEFLVKEGNRDAARQTLNTLLLPAIDEDVRTNAEALIRAMDRHRRGF